jgi:hypothetical protein
MSRLQAPAPVLLTFVLILAPASIVPPPNVGFPSARLAVAIKHHLQCPAPTCASLRIFQVSELLAETTVGINSTSRPTTANSNLTEGRHA